MARPSNFKIVREVGVPYSYCDPTLPSRQSTCWGLLQIWHLQGHIQLALITPTPQFHSQSLFGDDLKESCTPTECSQVKGYLHQRLPMLSLRRVFTKRRRSKSTDDSTQTATSSDHPKIDSNGAISGSFMLTPKIWRRRTMPALPSVPDESVRYSTLSGYSPVVKSNFRG